MCTDTNSAARYWGENRRMENCATPSSETIHCFAKKCLTFFFLPFSSFFPSPSSTSLPSPVCRIGILETRYTYAKRRKIAQHPSPWKSSKNLSKRTGVKNCSRKRERSEVGGRSWTPVHSQSFPPPCYARKPITHSTRLKNSLVPLICANSVSQRRGFLGTLFGEYFCTVEIPPGSVRMRY